MKPEWRWWPAALDIYPNEALIAKIVAPVLVMHVRATVRHACPGHAAGWSATDWCVERG